MTKYKNLSTCLMVFALSPPPPPPPPHPHHHHLLLLQGKATLAPLRAMDAHPTSSEHSREVGSESTLFHVHAKSLLIQAKKSEGVQSVGSLPPHSRIRSSHLNLLPDIHKRRKSNRSPSLPLPPSPSLPLPPSLSLPPSHSPSLPLSLTLSLSLCLSLSLSVSLWLRFDSKHGN